MNKGIDRKTYNRRYYELNKDRINTRRKRKYHLDKNFAERCKKRSRDSYRKKYKAVGKADRTVIKSGDSTFYTSGYFWGVAGRAPSTVRTFQRKGVIPEATIVTDSGWRLYTENQKDLILEMFRAYDDGKIKTMREFTPYLQENWEK